MPAIVIPVWNDYQVYPANTLVKYNDVYYVSTIRNANSTPSDLTNWELLVSAIGTLIPEDTPVNGAAAAATLTFSGVVTDAETVTIGVDVYEFDDDASVTAGNIAVDVSGGATASDAVTALVAAITASATEDVSAADGTGDTVVVTYGVAGTIGNAIAVSTDCANGTWGVGVTTLEDGVDGTTGLEGQMARDNSYLYVCIAANGTADTNWRRITLGSAY